MVLDKTGTITVGKPQVVEIRGFQGTSEETLRIAAALESESSHPLATAVNDFWESKGHGSSTVSGTKTLAGLGMTGYLDGVEVAVGSLDLIQTKTDSIPLEVEAEISEMSLLGSNVMLVSRIGN